MEQRRQLPQQEKIEKMVPNSPSGTLQTTLTQSGKGGAVKSEAHWKSLSKVPTPADPTPHMCTYAQQPRNTGTE
jgi:hypothetical protein